MQKKLLFLIFGFLSIVVVVLLYLLFVSSNIENSPEKIVKIEKAKKETLFKDNFEGWTEKLSKYKKSDFFMPINELFISMNFPKIKEKLKKEEDKKESYYKLIINYLDNYSLFCILQIFNKLDSPFIIEKDFKESRLYVKAKSRSKLDQISNELKRYGIKYEIK